MNDVLFSVVIPVWNRGNSVIRTIESVYAQNYDAYEVIVVDDGSEDDSVAQIKNIANDKVRLIRHPENRGVCAARRTGTNASRGEWVISLDSDWTLKPNAMQELNQMAGVAEEDVGVIGGMAQLDNGAIIPETPFPKEPFGFIEYLRWIDKTQISDYQPCRRKAVFDETPWPSDFRLESKFHMTVASQWKMWISDKIIACSHLDCENRWSTDDSKRGVRGRLKRAPFIAKDSEEIIDVFGALIKTHAPNYFYRTLYKASYYNFWSGNRWKGLSYGIRALCLKPKSYQLLGLLTTGVFGVKSMLMLRENKFLRKISQHAYALSRN